MRPVYYFTVSAVIDHLPDHEPRQTADATLCQCTSELGRRRAIRNAERRIMRRNPSWGRITWTVGQPMLGRR